MNARHFDPNKLKQLRKEHQLTQEAVAERIGVHRQTVYRAERGLDIPYELLCDLSSVYDVEVVTLLYPKPLRCATASATA